MERLFGNICGLSFIQILFQSFRISFLTSPQKGLCVEEHGVVSHKGRSVCVCLGQWGLRAVIYLVSVPAEMCCCFSGGISLSSLMPLALCPVSAGLWPPWTPPLPLGLRYLLRSDPQVLPLLSRTLAGGNVGASVPWTDCCPNVSSGRCSLPRSFLHLPLTLEFSDLVMFVWIFYEPLGVPTPLGHMWKTEGTPPSLCRATCIFFQCGGRI